MKKRVGIDVRAFLEGKRTGVEEYTLNLLKNLFELEKKESGIDYFLFYNSFKEPATFSRFLQKSAKSCRLKDFHFPNKIFNLSLKLFKRPYLDRLSGGVETFFMPSFRLAPLSKNARLVVTFHDLSFERYPEFFSRGRRFWHSLMNPREIAARANKILAISASTRDDLISLYGVKPEKIKVTYLGVDKKYRLLDKDNPNFLKVKRKYHLPENFILFLGTIEPRKNLVGLLRAFYLLKKKHKIKEKLVIAGIKGWLFEEVFEANRKLGFKKDVIFTGFVADRDKPYLYNLAKVFVYPSFYEGFGFPPLEAAACGTPVVTSNVSSLPEVIGSGGILINPFKPEEIAEAILSVLEDKEFREILVQRGLKKAKKFSWEKCARETRKILLNC